MRKELKGLVTEEVSVETSSVMSSIKSSRNKSTELKLQMIFVANKFRGYKLQDKNLLGRPDFVFANGKVLIFVDGCFWHGCPKCFKTPKKNTKFWIEKIRINQLRDKKINKHYKKNGIKVVRIWEHQLKSNYRKTLVNMLTKLIK